MCVRTNASEPSELLLCAKRNGVVELMASGRYQLAADFRPNSPGTSPSVLEHPSIPLLEALWAAKVTGGTARELRRLLGENTLKRLVGNELDRAAAADVFEVYTFDRCDERFYNPLLHHPSKHDLPPDQLVFEQLIDHLTRPCDRYDTGGWARLEHLDTFLHYAWRRRALYTLVGVSDISGFADMAMRAGLLERNYRQSGPFYRLTPERVKRHAER